MQRFASLTLITLLTLLSLGQAQVSGFAGQAPSALVNLKLASAPQVGEEVGAGWRVQYQAPAGGAVDLMAVAAPDAQHVYAVGATGATDCGRDCPGVILRSLDGGSTWANVAPDPATIPGGYGFFASVAFPTPTEGWVAGDRGVILHTTDGGSHWTQMPLPAWINKYGDAGSRTQPFLSISCADADRCFFATTFRGGTMWRWLRNPPPGVSGFAHVYINYTPNSPDDSARNVDANSVVSYPFGPTLSDTYVWLTVFERSGGQPKYNHYLSLDGGLTWVPSINWRPDPFPVPLRSGSFANSTVGWLVGDTSQIFASYDKGADWCPPSMADPHLNARDADAKCAQPVGGITDAHLLGVKFLDRYHGYAVGTRCAWTDADLIPQCGTNQKATVAETTSGGLDTDHGNLVTPASQNWGTIPFWHGTQLNLDGMLRGIDFAKSTEGQPTPGWAVGSRQVGGQKVGVILRLDAPASLRSFETLHAPILDGWLGDWVLGPQLALDAAHGLVTGSVRSGLSATLRSRWDHTALYFAVDVSDPFTGAADAVHLRLASPQGITTTNSNVGNHDLLIGRNGQITEHGAPALGVTAQVRNRVGGYRVELALPASQLGQAFPDEELEDTPPNANAFKADASIGLALGIVDDTGGRLESAGSDPIEFASLRLKSKYYLLQAKQSADEEDSAIEDTYIDELEPDQGHTYKDNTGTNNAVRYRGTPGQQKTGLYKFDVGKLNLPATGIITASTLSLYPIDVENPSPLTVDVYAVNRPWTVEATWDVAALSPQVAPWRVPGAYGVPDDIDGTPAGTAVFRAKCNWVAWSVDSILQRWVQNPPSIHGILARARPAATNSQWSVVSQESSDKARSDPNCPRAQNQSDPVALAPQGPKLEFYYDLYVPNPQPPPADTPTLTATVTASVMPSATPTATATQTATATAPATATLTPQPTHTATAVPATLTATPTTPKLKTFLPYLAVTRS